MRAAKEVLQFSLSDQQYDRLLRYLGHLAFLALGILSLVYYKERMLHFDAANYGFHMIYESTFYTGHHRYISYLPQLIPLLVQKSGGSLQAILMSYSASFILLHYLIFCVIVYSFKNSRGGLFLALACTLTVRYKFYGPVGEVFLGIPFVVLVLAWLMSDRYQAAGQRLSKISVAVICSGFLLVTHPFPMITLGFCWLIWMIYTRRWRITYEWILPFSWLLTWSVKLWIQGVGTNYEVTRANQFLEAQKVLTNLGDYYVWDRLGWYINVHHLLPLLLFGGALIYLFVQKKIWTALSSILAFTVITGITIVLFSYLDYSVAILLDGYLAHLGVIMALVFILSFGHRREWWMAGIFVFLLIFSVDRIKGAHHYFTQREDILLGVLNHHLEPDQHKLLTSMDAFDWDKLWMPWAVGIETLMMSTLETPDTPKTLFFYRNKENVAELLDSPDLFFPFHYFIDAYEGDQFPAQLALPPSKYVEVDLKGKY